MGRKKKGRKKKGKKAEKKREKKRLLLEGFRWHSVGSRVRPRENIAGFIVHFTNKREVAGRGGRREKMKLCFWGLFSSLLHTCTSAHTAHIRWAHTA